MKRSKLAAAVDSGLKEANPQESIRMVKQAVRKGIMALDGTSILHDTDYFNHSFAPDFILQWGRNQAFKRPVYLKFADDPGYLAKELHFVADCHPLVVELGADMSQGSHAAPEDRGRLEETAKSNDTMVTDPDGLANLEQGQQREPTLKLLNRALLQGGRGVMDGEAAVQTSNDVASGIAAAQLLNQEPTRRASEILNEVLGGPSRSRVQRFLQALWVGSGGSESNFPGEATLSGALDDDALAFLLQIEGVSETPEFWRRIGSQLTVDQLARLPLDPEYFANLQLLIAANLDRLWARVLKIVDRGGQMSFQETGEPYAQWVVRNGILCLITDSYEALVGTLSEQLDKISVVSEEPLVGELLDRARANRIRLGELLLSVGNRFLSYGSNDDGDVSEDVELVRLTQSLAPSARVRSAVATLSSGKHLNIYFSRLTAIGEGPAKIPLKELVLTGTSLLYGKQRTAGADVIAILSEEPEESTLF
jgi:hypothetical protein